jgi:glycosyltransferase involved in cell wall biosynthesis
LLLDGQALQTSSSRQRGIGRYSSNLLRALAFARPNWQIEVVQNRALAAIPADDLNGLSLLSFQPPLPLHDEYRELNERYYADWLTARGADGVLVLSHCEGPEAVVPSFCGSRPRVFGIAYDLIPLLYPEHYLSDFGTAHWYAHRFRHLLRCDALLAISEATAHDLRNLGGSEAPLVVNIGGAVDPLFAPLSVSQLAPRGRQIRERFGLHRDFILYVGAPDYRKNLHGAIRAFAALPPEHRAALDLAVVCRLKPAERAFVEETTRQAGVAACVRLICSADDEDLRALYQMCRLFFFPSLYEGLGLPVLEALHCGAPVVTSDCSSLPEYAGPVSWLGDPTSPQAIAKVLQQALAEPRDARRSEREAFARTFSWPRSAERACAVMERIVKRPILPVRRRRRLAWVMPLNRDMCGMIEYAEEWLPRLSERFDIELVAAADAMESSKTLSRRHLLLTAQELLARHAASPYDMFLYLMPPPEHLDMLHLMRQFPGLLVLHDFSLTTLRCLLQSKLLSWPALGDCPEDAFAPVLGVLVHSITAWQQVRRAGNVPVTHVELPSLPPPTQASASEPLAAYAGWIDLAISRYERSEGPWRSFVVPCLAERGEAATGAILDSWVSLRIQGQTKHRDAREESLTSSFPSCAWERRLGSSASRPTPEPHAKQSFADVRSQAQLGNEKERTKQERIMG